MSAVDFIYIMYRLPSLTPLHMQMARDIYIIHTLPSLPWRSFRFLAGGALTLLAIFESVMRRLKTHVQRRQHVTMWRVRMRGKAKLLPFQTK